MDKIKIPQPDVGINNTEDGKSYVVISRDGKAKSYEVEGIEPNEKIKKVVEKIINDPNTYEWLPK